MLNQENHEKMALWGYPEKFYYVSFYFDYDVTKLCDSEVKCAVREYVFKEQWEDELGKHVVWDLLPDKDPKKVYKVGNIDSHNVGWLSLDELRRSAGCDYNQAYYCYTYSVYSADLQKAKKMVVDAAWEDLEKLTQIIGRVEKELENLEGVSSGALR